ncbi:MAG: hypothetical protein Q4B88_03280 [Moraxella sp.]|nr:hypothetical protein [Moraxella sp.]
MLITYLKKLSHDLHTASDLLSKMSKASHNPEASNILDGIVTRLNVHATQIDKIIDHAKAQKPQKT